MPRLYLHSPVPQYVFMAWCLVKHMDKFTFIFLPNMFCGNVPDVR